MWKNVAFQNLPNFPLTYRWKVHLFRWGNSQFLTCDLKWTKKNLTTLPPWPNSTNILNIYFTYIEIINNDHVMERITWSSLAVDFGEKKRRISSFCLWIAWILAAWLWIIYRWSVDRCLFAKEKTAKHNEIGKFISKIL